MSVAAQAAEPVADDGEALVSAFVNDVVTFAADFEQSLIDPDGRMLEKTSGTLEIQRPGRFRWMYVEPYEQWLVADGANIWSYDVDLEQVTVKPQAEALANTPALLLGGSGEAMDQFEHGGSFEDAGFTWVRLLPIDTESGFRRVELGFGVLIELCQRMVGYRSAEWLDIGADVGGIAIGLAIGLAGVGGWSQRFENRYLVGAADASID